MLKITGQLLGKEIIIPEVNSPPMPSLAAPGVIHNGNPATSFGGIDSNRGYPDVRSFARKFAFLIRATNYIFAIAIRYSARSYNDINKSHHRITYLQSLRSIEDRFIPSFAKHFEEWRCNYSLRHRKFSQTLLRKN
jgi:hypothetical protein